MEQLSANSLPIFQEAYQIFGDQLALVIYVSIRYGISNLSELESYIAENANRLASGTINYFDPNNPNGISATFGVPQNLGSSWNGSTEPNPDGPLPDEVEDY